MINLILDPFDKALSIALASAANAAGLAATVIDLGDNPDAINRWRLRCVPCLAFVHDGVAIYLTQDPAAVATFEADAQTAVDAYEAAKVAP